MGSHNGGLAAPNQGSYLCPRERGVDVAHNNFEIVAIGWTQPGLASSHCQFFVQSNWCHRVQMNWIWCKHYSKQQTIACSPKKKKNSISPTPSDHNASVWCTHAPNRWCTSAHEGQRPSMDKILQHCDFGWEPTFVVHAPMLFCKSFSHWLSATNVFAMPTTLTSSHMCNHFDTQNWVKTNSLCLCTFSCFAQWCACFMTTFVTYFEIFAP